MYVDNISRTHVSAMDGERNIPMSVHNYNWSEIAENTKFIHLHRKKSAFLIRLWLIGALPYLLLVIGAGYAPELYKTRIIERMNVGYLFCMVQFFTMVIIAVYYMYRANKTFDPLTKELLEDIKRGNGQ